MDLKALLPIAVRGSILLLVLALGLRATPADALSLLRRPGLLMRSIVAINLIVPLLATLVAWMLPLAPAVKAGIVLMAVSPVPPLVPGKQLRFASDVSYVCGLLVAISLLSVVTVPATLAIIGAAFERHAWLPPSSLARLVASSVLLPLGIGIAIRGINPAFAHRSAGPVFLLAHVVLALAIVPVLLAEGPAIWQLIDSGSVAAIAVVTAGALAAGHHLGGPEPEHRGALAFASATRHPGIALMIARGAGAGAEVTAAILLFLLASAVAVVPYQVWQKRRLKRRTVIGAAASAASRPELGRSR